MTWDGEDRRKPEGWKLKKEISLGDAVALVMAASAVLYSYSTLDKRLTVLEQITQQQIQRDDRQDEVVRDLTVEIKVELRRLNEKLDRQLERSRGQ